MEREKEERMARGKGKGINEGKKEKSGNMKR
jgi:hypothetical protein